MSAAVVPYTSVPGDQETHPQDLFRECSVYCELVSTPEMAPRILEMAMRAAVEENGVAVVVVPGEVFLQKADATEWHSLPIVATRSVVCPDDESLWAAAAILNDAEAVTILGGAGVAAAHDALIHLAGTLNAPIVHALRGKEFIEYDNPFDVGMTGLLGFASGYKAIKDADALLMLGTDFPYQQFYPDNAKVIQVDLRGRNLGRRTPIDLGLVGTVKDTLAALQPLLRQKDRRDHLDRSLRHYRKTRKTLDELAVNDRDRTPIRPEYVAGLANRLAADDAVFTVDVGSPVVWAARYVTMNGRRRLVGSFNHGTMACALPHAIGAQTAFRGRQVVALAGDGGLTMLFGELVTLIQNRLPVKVIVFNNSSLNFVELEMKAAGIVNFGTDLVNPNFADVAKAMGIFGRRVEQPADLEQALTDAFALRRTRRCRRRDRPSGAVHTACHHRRTGQGLLAVRDPDHPGGAGRRAARPGHHQRRAAHPGLIRGVTYANTCRKGSTPAAARRTTATDRSRSGWPGAPRRGRRLRRCRRATRATSPRRHARCG